MKKKQASESPRYKRFVNERDRTLEKLLLKTRAKVSDLLRLAINTARDEVTRSYHHLNQENIDPKTVMELRNLDARLDTQFYSVAFNMAQEWTKLRRYTYLLSYAGEQAALSNAGVHTKSQAPMISQTVSSSQGETELGSVDSRTYYNLSKIRRKILTQVDLSRIMGDDLATAVDKAMKVFPRGSLVKTPRVLKRLAEANKEDEDLDSLMEEIGMNPPVDFINRDEWESLLSDYKTAYVPKWRDPRAGELESPVSIGEDEGYVLYPWELENEITDDFVHKVRDGESDAADAKGITDFVWVAVVDDRTDECCLIRDGLLTSEIDEQIKDGLGSSPPIHFNCRCRLVPATDDIPDKPETGEVDFEKWLNS